MTTATNPQPDGRAADARTTRRLLLGLGGSIGVAGGAAWLASQAQPGPAAPSATPGTPAASPDYLTVTPVREPPGTSTARIATPHFAVLWLDSRASQTVDSEQILSGADDLRAAPDHEFIAIRLKQQVASHAPDRSLRIGLVVAGVERPLRQLFPDMTFGSSLQETPPARVVSIVASVPIGGPVALRIHDVDQTLEVDCRTGNVVESPTVAAVALLTSVSPLQTGFQKQERKLRCTIERYPGSSQKTVAVTTTYRLRQAMLMPWHDRAGWAPTGSAWLRVMLTLERSLEPGLASRLDVRAAFTLSVDGRRLQARVSPFDTLEALATDQAVELLYEVPATLRDAELVVDLNQPVDQDFDGQVTPVSSRSTLAVDRISLRFA